MCELVGELCTIVYPWRRKDDGGLGRAPSDSSDAGPSDVGPRRLTMPSGVAVRNVSCV